jgi:hypothetical protein
MSERDRGERPKKSWRELDANRDRAGGSTPRRDGPPSRSTAEQERNSKQYRAALDAMFEKGEIGKMAEKLTQTRQPPSLVDMPAKKAEPPPEPVKPVEKVEDPKTTLRKKVLAALGRDEISRAVDKYVKAHGWPADFEILEQALEHQKDDRVREAMDTLSQLLDREKPKRNRTLIGKLRFIEETNGDSELREIAAKLRARL